MASTVSVCGGGGVVAGAVLWIGASIFGLAAIQQCDEQRHGMVVLETTGVLDMHIDVGLG
jgi:hypothetical protein